MRLSLGNALGVMAYACLQGVEMNEQSEQSPLELPRLTVQAEERYLIGFPLIIAITIANDTKDHRFYQLPKADLIRASGPLGISLVGTLGANRYDRQPSAFDEGSSGMSLMPGEQKTLLLDVTNFGFPLAADTYAVTVNIRAANHDVTSEPVRITLIAPPARDSAEAVRLRALGRPSPDTGAWAPFLTNNWNTVRVSPELDPRAREQLSLHLFLHYALYGPHPIDKLGTDRLAEIRQASLAPEVEALSFEIRAPQLDEVRRKALFNETVKRWPGIRFRLERALEGEGWLHIYRDAVGAEADLPRQGPPPYRDQDR